MSEAALQAEIMKQFQAPIDAQQQQPMGGGEQGPPPPTGANPSDPTGAGGGNIGTGQAPVPGERGFSGNGGQANTQPNENVGQQPPTNEQLQ
jgi:hypothetical protein